MYLLVVCVVKTRVWPQQGPSSWARPPRPPGPQLADARFWARCSRMSACDVALLQMVPSQAHRNSTGSALPATRAAGVSTQSRLFSKCGRATARSSSMPSRHLASRRRRQHEPRVRATTPLPPPPCPPLLCASSYLAIKQPNPRPYLAIKQPNPRPSSHHSCGENKVPRLVRPASRRGAACSTRQHRPRPNSYSKRSFVACWHGFASQVLFTLSTGAQTKDRLCSCTRAGGAAMPAKWGGLPQGGRRTHPRLPHHSCAVHKAVTFRSLTRCTVS